MDFVATSQPLQDGEEDLSYSCWPYLGLKSGNGDHSEAENDSYDVISSSQPLEDGEELSLHTDLKTPLPYLFPQPETPSHPRQLEIRAHRARLIRRASPVKLTSTWTSVQPSVPRSRNLVRRVTMAAEMERKKRRAHDEARRILKKIRKLTETTMRLRRKHRHLCILAAAAPRSIENKENICYMS
ncbi:hypothetical protein B0H19DRAFT_1366767 [Mycena capillaripes]|nr:hypothetical protein B0H19DRAFT_1366767 [Mycena capillaripes]